MAINIMQNPSPTPNSPKMPAFTRLFRWLFSWSMLRRAPVCVAALITLLAVVWTEENWRGKRAWENYRREWEAKGEKFDLQAFIPPPVPDDQNFAMTPFLAPVTDFNPLPLKPGQSPWRDTNAYQRTLDFGYKESPSSSGSWTKTHLTDLTAWAAALDGKKDAPASGESSAERAAAARKVLQQLEAYKPVLSELHTASQRPYCHFPILRREDPTKNLYPHLSVLKKFALMYELRASAELAAGKSNEALEDIKMVLYLAEAEKSEPTLLAYLVRIAILNISLQPIWEGLADHRWSDAQLRELQQRLGKIDLLTEYGTAMRGERAFNNAGVDYWIRQKNFKNLFNSDDEESSGAGLLFPNGWVYQNKLAINQMYQQTILPSVDGATHRVNVAEFVKNQADLERDLQTGFVYYKLFARLLLPAISKAGQKFAYTQANVDQAVVACGLERYRLTHGQFPETLDALIPQFADKIPHDLITGEPLKYHRTEDGYFVLYSVGWNGKDDGGKTVLTNDKEKFRRVDITQGDWVWPYPAK